MSNRTFGIIDFNDPARQGAHVAEFVHNEKFDYLVYEVHPTFTSTYPSDRAKVKWVGDGNALIIRPSLITYSGPTPIHYYPQIFRTFEYLPENCVVEIVFGTDVAGYQHGINFGIIDAEDLNYVADVIPNESYVMYLTNLSRFKTLFQITDHSYTMKRDLTGKIQYNESTYDYPALHTGAFYRMILIKKATGFLYQFYTWNGIQILTPRFITAASVLNFNTPSFWAMGFGQTGGGFVPLRSLFIQEFKENDFVSQSPCVVTTDGTPSLGPGTQKTCLTDGFESSYVTLTPGQEILIDITGASYDKALYYFSCIANCTDANPLQLRVAANDMGTVFTNAIEIGNTKNAFASLEALSGWTNTVRHVGWPQLNYLLNKFWNETTALRKIKLINKSTNSNPINVYDAKACESLSDITTLDSADTLLDGNYMIPVDDIKIGEPGNTKTLKYVNSSSVTANTVYLRMADDGNADADQLEFSINGTDWFNFHTQPANGLTLGTSVAPGTEIPWYLRTNIPNTDPALASFAAKFKYKIM